MKATIDIGTNSVLLLIGKPIRGSSFKVVCDRAEGTRLGEGLTARGTISPEAADRTTAVLREYRKLCDEHGCDEIAVVGTAALRQSANSDEFKLEVKRELDLDIEIISKEREAELTYAASKRDFGNRIIVLDIGGGSTELITEKGDEVIRLLSMPTGCVSLLESFVPSDPISLGDMGDLRHAIKNTLDSFVDSETYANRGGKKLIATAGTATTLMAIRLRLEPYDPAVVHGKKLSAAEMKNVVNAIASRTVSERVKDLKGLNPQRADVILTGAVLLQEAMDYLGYSEVTISDRGVKWGLFYERFCK